MKKILFAGVALALMTTTTMAAPSCVPRYTKDAGAWWFSVIMLPPLLILNVMARVGDLPNRGKHLHGLTCTTVAIGYHAVHGHRNFASSRPQPKAHSVSGSPSYVGNWVNAGRIL